MYTGVTLTRRFCVSVLICVSSLATSINLHPFIKRTFLQNWAIFGSKKNNCQFNWKRITDFVVKNVSRKYYTFLAVEGICSA
jgi:hypothetical protein